MTDALTYFFNACGGVSFLLLLCSLVVLLVLALALSDDLR